MKILQAYKFQLKAKPRHEELFRRSAGCCRFVWNHMLALEKENHENGRKRLGYRELAGMLTDLKNQEKTKFLKEVHSQILQQSLKDLENAYRNFFQKRAMLPRFKSKGVKDSFRYPQGFKIDEPNFRIYLPKIGWVRYRKSKNIEGRPKQITVSLSAEKWYVSVQTEREIADPIHTSDSAIGVDMGVANFATFSDGTFIKPPNFFQKHENKLKFRGRNLSRKKKFSNNWRKEKHRLNRIHRKIKDCRRDFLHKLTTDMSKNHALIAMEDLQVKNMSKSASGTVDNPGRNVKAKTGLNKSILDQWWFEFRRQLEYKLTRRGGELLLIPPQYTSQKCSDCGHVAKENRESQAKFKCCNCGFEINADHNAAINILAAGHAVKACGEIGNGRLCETGTSSTL
ncbi:MAG: transposase [Tannerella sp.]|nr:transposase [Tannerella sp.]